MRYFRDILLHAVFGLFALSQFAFAQTAEDAFIAGEYGKAIALSVDAGSADAAAFCARAALAATVSNSDGPSPDQINIALAQADLALSLQANHIEGRLQRAIALSLLARPMKLREARRSGYGETSRELAESVLADDPDNVYAHGFLAVWHLEVIRRGGRIGAMMMDADKATARDHYQKAAALGPDDASVHWQYARALAALNTKRNLVDIQLSLAAAAAAKPDSVLETTMQARAAHLAILLETEDSALAQTWARQTL